MEKMVYYRVNADQNPAMKREFQVGGYPTVIFLKPDGNEFHRFAGAYRSGTDLAKVIASILPKAGILTPKPKTVTPANLAIENAAKHKLSNAETNLRVGRKKDAVKTLQEIIEKYPDTEAASKAQEYFDSLSDVK